MTHPRSTRRPARGLIALTLLGLAVIVAGGCAGGFQRVKPTELDQAQHEIPESQLLDIGVTISDAPELSDSKLKKQGTTPEVRRAEACYIPFHLKNTLQMSAYWGTVQVVPPEDEFVDLAITSELIESNGETVKLAVEAVDAAGHVWLSRKYHATLKHADYSHTLQGEHEASQDLFNTIANDLADFKRTLTPEQIEQIRTVAQLRFAREFAPKAYGDYLAEDGDGHLTLQRLPADDDPLMVRIEEIRGREQMFVDTLNQYYEGYYMRMWEPYENWRRYYLVEQVAKREAERDAFMRTLGGILMIASAVALQTQDVPNTGAVSGILIVAGGQVVVSGINVSQQVQLHEAAIQELAESFGAEMQPSVVELEGKQYELTGTAEEQYQHWKSLLLQIYHEETGFDADTEAYATEAAADVAPTGP